MDVALHRLPVVFALDRAGVTGEDGASHHGMWDLSLMALVPGLTLAAPRDEPRLIEAFDEAMARTDGPGVVRYSKGALPDPMPAVRRIGGVDLMRDAGGEPSETVLLVAYGAMVPMALEAASRAADQGIEVRVVDPRYVVPVPDELLELARQARLVVTLEDNGVQGGAGSTLAGALRAAGIDTPLRDLGLPQQFLPQGKRGQVLSGVGMTAQVIARQLTEAVAALESTLNAQAAGA
jgi:1-deoxy-D-xylulose-5-phosphate synthase